MALAVLEAADLEEGVLSEALTEAKTRDLERLASKLTEMGAKEVTGDDKIVKISLVGVGMRSHAGIASTMFEALAKEGVNIRMISTSEIKISVVVDEKYLELGVRTLHDTFNLAQPEKV